VEIRREVQEILMKARHAFAIGLLSVLFTLWWTNPQTYTDGAPISERDQQELITMIYNGPSTSGPWEFYGWVQYGEEYYESTAGQYNYYCARSELYGHTGPWWDPLYVKKGWDK
jgi:hypothetical protein